MFALRPLSSVFQPWRSTRGGHERAAGLCLLQALSVACTTLAPPPALPDPTHYVASVTLSQTSAPGGTRLVGDPQEARQLLRPGSTLAFVPPAECSAAAPPTYCSSLMSALEEAAAEAGYRVVSWRMLDGATTRGRRRASPSAVVEIVHYESGAARPLQVRETKIDFYEQRSRDARSPLVLPDVDEVAQRCMTTVQEVTGSNVDLPVARLEAKVSSPESGEVLWFYDEQVRLEGTEAASGLDLYYTARPRRVPDNRARDLEIAGWSTAGVGALTLGIGTYTTVATYETDLGLALIGVGATAMVTGLIVAAVGIRRTRNNPAGRVLIPAAETVICNSIPSARNPFDPKAADQAPDLREGSSARFSEILGFDRATLERLLIEESTRSIMLALGTLAE